MENRDKETRNMIHDLMRMSELECGQFVSNLSKDVVDEVVVITLQELKETRAHLEETNKAVRLSSLGNQLPPVFVSDVSINYDDFALNDDGVARMLPHNDQHSAMRATGEEDEDRLNAFIEMSELDSAKKDSAPTFGEEPVPLPFGSSGRPDHEDQNRAEAISALDSKDIVLPLSPDSASLPPTTHPHMPPNHQSGRPGPSSSTTGDLSPSLLLHTSLPLMILLSENNLRPIHELPPDICATLRERFTSLCTCTKSRTIAFKKICNAADKRLNHGICIRSELVNSSNPSSWEMGGASRQSADDVCLRLGSPCCYVMLHGCNYVFGIVPVPERLRGEWSWQDLGFWVLISVPFKASMK